MAQMVRVDPGEGLEVPAVDRAVLAAVVEAPREAEGVVGEAVVADLEEAGVGAEAAAALPRAGDTRLR